MVESICPFCGDIDFGEYNKTLKSFVCYSCLDSYDLKELSNAEVDTQCVSCGKIKKVKAHNYGRGMYICNFCNWKFEREFKLITMRMHPDFYGSDLSDYEFSKQ